MASPTWSNTTTGTNTKTASRPSGTGGKLIFMGVVYDVSSSAGAASLSGWTQVGFGTVSGRVNVWVWEKTADAGDPASFTFTGPAGYSEAACTRVTHTSGTPTVVDSDVVTVGGAGGTIAIPAVDVTDDAILVLNHGGYSGTISSAPTGYTQRAVWDTVNYVYTSETTGSGTKGPTNYTIATSGGFSDSVGIVVAVQAPGGGATLSRIPVRRRPALRFR